MEISFSERGFWCVPMVDAYGESFSVRESSAASAPHVWVGLDEVKPKILRSKARQYGLEFNGPEEGWMAYPVPTDVLLSGSIHLDKDGARTLIEALVHFVNSED